MLLPSVINIEKSEVVAIRMVELRLFLVSQGLLVSWSIEYILDLKHGCDGENFIGAAQVDGCQQHLRELWLNRKFCHHAAKSRQQSFIIKSAEGIELLHGCYQGLDRRRVHEIKVDQVVDAHSFQGQDSG